MSPHRLFKRLARQASVVWREQPSQYDIEELEANIRRVGLVIRIRWMLVAALSVFSLFAAAIYAADGKAATLSDNMLVPGVALTVVIVYNGFYQSIYRRLGNVAILNQAQLVLDMLVASVLVYYSGGAFSWFDAVFLLFVLEAALILPRRRNVWALASFAIILYGAILLSEYYGGLDHIPIPFVDNALHGEPAFVATRFLWFVAMVAGTALIGTKIIEEQRRQAFRCLEGSTIDVATKLPNRSEFLRRLRDEVKRSSRAGRPVTLILVDVDDFGRVNNALGFQEGTRLLGDIAHTIEGTLKDASEPDFELATVFRFGGEEFAVVLPHDRPAISSGEAVAQAGRLAELVRESARSLRVENMTLTFSVGAATFPSEAVDADDLVSVADSGVARANAAGGDRVGGRASDE